MKRISVSQYLFALVAIPLVGLIIAAVILVAGAMAVKRDAALTHDLMDVAVSGGNLIHTLQIERGATAGFLQSKGAKFSDALPGIRANSDRNLSDFELKSKSGESSGHAQLAQKIVEARQQLKDLGDVRARASRQDLTVPEAVKRYSETIGSLIDIIAMSGRASSDPQILRRSVAYLNLVKAKEQAGQERALVTAAFAADTVDAERLRQILQRFNRQDAYFDVFRAFAEAGDLSAVKEALESPAAKDVQTMRTTLLARASAGGQGIAPELWFKTITDKIDALHVAEGKITDGISEDAQVTLGRQTRNVTAYVVGSLLSLAVAALAAWWISRQVGGPLHAQSSAAAAIIQDNDLTRKVPEGGPTEVHLAAEAFNALLGSFRTTIEGMIRSSSQITEAATRLSRTSHDLKSSSSSQSDATSSVAAAVEEASVSVGETAANTESVAGLVQSAHSSTNEAIRVMGSTVSHMKEIAARIDSAAGRVTHLKDSSVKIGGIVKVIQEIAEQTNLLALNAAIEAARAGEQGRGFAVVADEVRKLAERATTATREIGTVIVSIQQGVDESVDTMVQATDHAHESLSLVSATEGALSQIDSESRSVDENVRSISHALKEQDAAIRQVAVNIEQIAQLTEQNYGEAAKSDSLAVELSSLASHLRESVAKFKV